MADYSREVIKITQQGRGIYVGIECILRIEEVCAILEKGKTVKLQIDGLFHPSAHAERTALQMIRHALDLQILVIDKSPIYWGCQWEKNPIVGKWLIMAPNMYEMITGSSVKEAIAQRSEALREASVEFDKLMGIRQ